MFQRFGKFEFRDNSADGGFRSSPAFSTENSSNFCFAKSGGETDSSDFCHEFVGIFWCADEKRSTRFGSEPTDFLTTLPFKKCAPSHAKSVGGSGKSVLSPEMEDLLPPLFDGSFSEFGSSHTEEFTSSADPSYDEDCRNLDCEYLIVSQSRMCLNLYRIE